MTIHTITKENFTAFIQQHELVVLDFSAEWCGPCRSFAKVCEEAAKRFPQAAFGNVDIEKQPELAQDFNVHSVPWVLILRHGLAVFAQAGAMSFVTLTNLIQQAEALDVAAIEQQIRGHKAD